MSGFMQVERSVIQEKEVLRGGTEPLKVNVRFIAATNRDIQDVIKQVNSGRTSIFV
jgi:transcriptional regulator with PAS, ATPase and Fis domain